MKAVAAVLALVLTTACASDDDSDVSYTLNYTDGNRSQAVADNKALNECAALGGVKRQGIRDDYLAGGATLRFSGSDKERERLEECLRGLRARIILVTTRPDATPSPLAS